MEKNITTKALNRWLAMLILLITGTVQGMAQNVTIGPNNGSLITGQAGGNVDDSGIQRGMASMWMHEQLQLTMTTSDIANLTSAGELADPSCAIDKMSFNGEERLIIGAGQTQTFMVVSLPKGYRITSYRLVLQPNVYGNGIQLHPGNQSWDIGSDDQMRFYETPAWSSGSPYPSRTDQTTHSTTLECSDYIAVATASDGSITMQNDNATNRNKEFVISRTSPDMTNQLHFFFARASSQYAVSIKSFEIYFTAQGTFEADVLPAESGAAVSVLQSPFSTSKMDIGAVKWNNTLNVWYYDYTNVRDLIAYNWLYQEGAISGGKPTEDIVENKNIFPVEVDGKGAYAFGNDTYYIEPPTTIHTSTGAEAPIGYRIVGATFDYKWGTATQGGSKSISNGYRISVRYNGRNYYLNDNLDFVRTNSPFTWQVDEFGNLYTGTEYKRYLACFGEGDQRIISLSSSASGHEATWNLKVDKVDNNNRVYYHSDGGNDYYLHYIMRQEGSTDHLRGYVTKDYNNSNYIATASSTGSHNITIPSFTPGAYTLEIFGTDKTTPVETFRVNSAADANVYELTGLNNDAVKFRISGLDSDKQALVNVTLKLEALNPYIDKMDVVCHDAINPQTNKPTLELSQPFTASDFSVSGGKFIFYVPSDYSDDLLTFTFSNLYSHYGDNTYYTGTPDQTNETARYSFVTSDYFFPVNGNGNGGLYDDEYDPGADYTTKVFTSTAGNIRFKFNNAEELGASGGTGTRTLIEYPFSVAEYLGGYSDPDGSGKTGQFISCQLRADAAAGTQNTGIFYVFTADETRYNIAPTTALQHRSYAFYRMDIELRAKTFTPDFKWETIYPATLYDKDGTDAEDSMWGLTLDTSDTETVDGKPVKMESYLTYQEILNAITADINNTAKETATSMKQILYVDGTPLKAMLNSSQNAVVKKLEDLKAELPANALVFLPKNTTSTLDNVAYMTSSGAFRAGKDIILTDKQPFYSPYDITVDAANKATYTRELSDASFGQVTNATIMLPFTLTLNGEGLHTNDDGKCSFRVHTMVNNAQMKPVAPSTVDYGTAFFEPYTENVTQANKPYMVKVESIDESVSNNKKISFIATQKGSSIVKTPTDISNKFIEGESASGKFEDVTYNFTNYASYSGSVYDRAESENVFYFAKNKYVDLHTLIKSKQYLYVYPFRGVYTYETNASGAKMMKGFYISYNLDEMEDAGLVTALQEMDAETNADLMIRSGKGMLTITSTRDQNVSIRSISGMTIKNANLSAGGSTTVSLPAGIYIVNNTKITVK